MDKEKILKQISIRVIIPANENIANIFKDYYSVEIIGDRIILEFKGEKEDIIEDELVITGRVMNKEEVERIGKQIDNIIKAKQKSVLEDDETSLDEPTFKRKGLILKVK